MKRPSRVWISAIVFFAVLSGILLAPTFAGDRLPSWWGKVFSSRGISLGLDLEGGIFLLLGIETEEGVAQEMLIAQETLSSKLAENRILVKSSKIEGGRLSVDFFPGTDAERAAAIARDLGWEVVNEDPSQGIVEATDTTFWFGFKDDVAVRVRADGQGSRVDVRSVSRVGQGDLGANAQRIGEFLQKMKGE